MSGGLIGLLDDIAALAKLAAASLDDAAVQAAKAGTKAAGIVIDDAAVTPRYVVGLAAERELPIIKSIAAGSLKNKLVFLLPGALVLSFFAPWLITPLLMAGGAYLCFEGYHKVVDSLRGGHHDENGKDNPAAAAGTAEQLENVRISSAIRTDFILSSEIMAIALASVSGLSIWMQAGVLAVVGVGMTLLVYGAVALIVKADDAGVEMALSENSAVRAIGRGIAKGMPGFLKALSLVGMLAMLWVGGGIVLHGSHELGFKAPEELVDHAAEMVASGVPAAAAATVHWLIKASISGVIGLLIGAICAPLADYVLSPGVEWVRLRFRSSS